MRRSFVIVVVVLAALVLGLVKSSKFLGTRYTVTPAVSVAGESWYTPKVSGTGTADSVFVWRGSVTGLTDDATVIAISGLDTTLAYNLRVAVKSTTQYGVVDYFVYYPVAAATNDVDQCGFCNAVLSDCAGTTGTDAKFNTCLYASGATGLIEFENRLGAAVAFTWQLTGGG